MPTRHVLMVEPVGFRANPETATDNAFQRGAASPDSRVERAARAEFEALVAALRARGVEVETLIPQANPPTPDAVFPNNWFSTRPDGTLVLYPMRAPSRRAERRAAFVEWLRRDYPDIVDLSPAEEDGRFLEGTGSLVIDDPHGLVYASLSERTDPDLVEAWAERFDHTPIIFAARDRDGRPVYHTNVAMSVGTAWAVLTAEAIADDGQQAEVRDALQETDHETIEITLDQMHDFCGNVLEVENDRGERIVVMSDRAHGAFRSDQLEALRRHAAILHVDLATIETHGGGSARCMLAELH